MSDIEPFILEGIPTSRQHFLWCSQNSFQRIPLLFFNIYHCGLHLHSLLGHICLGLLCLYMLFSLLHLPWSKILQKKALVWFISFMWMSQLHCCFSHTYLISCSRQHAQYNERRSLRIFLKKKKKKSPFLVKMESCLIPAPFFPIWDVLLWECNGGRYSWNIGTMKKDIDSLLWTSWKNVIPLSYSWYC